MTRPTALIVSPQFPPSTLAGVHRARHLAKGLPTHGWRPVVLSVAPRHYTETVDPALAALVSDTLTQVRVGALPAWLCRAFGVGDIGLRAFAQLRAGLDIMIRRERPDVVLITGSPFYPLLLAGMVRQRHGTPVVLDFQDPWVSRFGEGQPAWSKSGLSHKLATVLEPIALRSADYVTSVSAVQNEEMAARYPWLPASRMAAIPIGGDPRDFDALRAGSPANLPTVLTAGRINFSYVGTFLPRAEPLVRTVFKALHALKMASPDLAARLQINFVGTSNQPDADRPGRVAALAADHGVADLVREMPRRVPYLDALSVLANSDALLMIGSDEPHYTASKIFPGLMSGRPFLSLFHEASSAHAILNGAGGGFTLSFRELTELPSLEARIAEAISKLALEPQSAGRADPSSYEAYTADAIAGDYALVFEQAVSVKNGNRPGRGGFAS